MSLLEIINLIIAERKTEFGPIIPMSVRHAIIKFNHSITDSVHVYIRNAHPDTIALVETVSKALPAMTSNAALAKHVRTPNALISLHLLQSASQTPNAQQLMSAISKPKNADQELVLILLVQTQKILVNLDIVSGNTIIFVVKANHLS